MQSDKQLDEEFNQKTNEGRSELHCHVIIIINLIR